MNWNAVGAIANLLGAAGVIASLIYLGIQIRQSTRTERVRAFQQIFASFAAQNLHMFGPANIEATIFSQTAYLLGDETLENWVYALRTRFLPYRGMREWWNEAKPIFAPATCAWVDKQISATDTESDYLSIKRTPA